MFRRIINSMNVNRPPAATTVAEPSSPPTLPQQAPSERRIAPQGNADGAPTSKRPRRRRRPSDKPQGAPAAQQFVQERPADGRESRPANRMAAGANGSRQAVQEGPANGRENRPANRNDGSANGSRQAVQEGPADGRENRPANRNDGSANGSRQAVQEGPADGRENRPASRNGNGANGSRQAVQDRPTDGRRSRPTSTNGVGGNDSRQRRVRAPRPVVDLQAGPLERSHAFGSISVSEPIRLALNDMNYETPTPIQEQAVPAMLEGRDVVGRAQTGTGKTTAFGIPMMEMLDPTSREVQGIVLAPTRELAVQVTGELTRLATHRGIKVVTLYGGQRIDTQFKALEDSPQIVVGTPGRVQDHMQRGTLRLGGVKIAILDEADQMLDIGFAEDMIRILRATPRARQTALFSATVPSFIRRMIERFQRDPVWIGIGKESGAADTIQQLYYEVAQQDKLAGLQEFCEPTSGKKKR